MKPSTKRNEKWVEAEARWRGITRSALREELRWAAIARSAAMPVTCPMVFCGSRVHGAEAHR